MTKKKKLVKGVDYDGWAIKNKKTGKYYGYDFYGMRILAVFRKSRVIIDAEHSIVRVKLVEVEP